MIFRKTPVVEAPFALDEPYEFSVDERGEGPNAPLPDDDIP